MAGHRYFYRLPLVPPAHEGRNPCVMKVSAHWKNFLQILNGNVLTWHLSSQAKLSIILALLLVSCYCYWLIERRLAKKVPHRLPRIPRPRHKVTCTESIVHDFFVKSIFLIGLLNRACFQQIICSCITTKLLVSGTSKTKNIGCTIDSHIQNKCYGEDTLFFQI